MGEKATQAALLFTDNKLFISVALIAVVVMVAVIVQIIDRSLFQALLEVKFCR